MCSTTIILRKQDDSVTGLKVVNSGNADDERRVDDEETAIVMITHMPPARASLCHVDQKFRVLLKSTFLYYGKLFLN